MSERTPPVLCIIGKQNSGKTALTVALTAELGRRGHVVMTVKHGHGFDMDMPGKDSWRHRHEGGAKRVVMACPSEFGVMGDWPDEEMTLTEIAGRFLSDADIVVAEGYKVWAEPKIEVFRTAEHDRPIYDSEDPTAGTFLAIVTDVPDFVAQVPVFDIEDPLVTRKLADLVEAELLDA